jgi:hypothetical protein
MVLQCIMLSGYYIICKTGINLLESRYKHILFTMVTILSSKQTTSFTPSVWKSSALVRINFSFRDVAIFPLSVN